MGVAREMGLDPAITAGAVISGAYFGDKLLAALRHRQPRLRRRRRPISTTTSASRSGPRCPRSSWRSLLSGASASRSSSTPRAWPRASRPPFSPRCMHFLPLALVLGARAHALAALRRHLPRRARRRRPRRRGRAGTGDRLRRGQGCRSASRSSRASGPTLSGGYVSTHRRARHRPAAVPGRHGEHARHRLADPGGARLRRLYRAGRSPRAADRPADRRGALGRRAGRDPRRRGVRHQRARLRPVHRRRAAGAHVPPGLRGARARAGRAVADARRLRRRDLAAHPLEQLRRLHGGDPRRRDHRLRPLRLLQPHQSARLDRLRLPRAPDAAVGGGGTRTRLARSERPTNPEAKEHLSMFPGRFNPRASAAPPPCWRSPPAHPRSPSRRPPPTSTG